MSKSRVVCVYDPEGYWEGLYVNGNLEFQEHCLDEERLLNAVKDIGPFDVQWVDSFDAGFDMEYECQYPETLEEFHELCRKGKR